MKICDQEVTPNIVAKKFWQEQLEVGFTNYPLTKKCLLIIW